jgi:hypothetical protein
VVVWAKRLDEGGDLKSVEQQSESYRTFRLFILAKVDFELVI